MSIICIVFLLISDLYRYHFQASTRQPEQSSCNLIRSWGECCQRPGCPGPWGLEHRGLTERTYRSPDFQMSLLWNVTLKKKNDDKKCLEKIQRYFHILMENLEGSNIGFSHKTFCCLNFPDMFSGNEMLFLMACPVRFGASQVAQW